MLPNATSAIKFNFAKATVVLVDASPMCLDVMSNILSAYGFRKLHRFTEIEPAEAMVRALPVDLLVLDPYSFGQQAYDFISRLRADHDLTNSGIPVIIATSYTPARVVTSIKQCGADYVVAKPFSTTGLLERILWVATSEGRKSGLIAPAESVSKEGSGVELW